MTAPIWMAFPPEVHSAQLSAGPGAGALLASAQAWSGLSAQYANAAAELAAVLSNVGAQIWHGPSSEAYVASQLRMVEWLNRTSADSANQAAQHEVMAGAYSAALAAMPTMAELAANHATHTALVATNFLGINTIGIAINEGEYAAYWARAAATMFTYDAVSKAAMATAASDNTPVNPAGSLQWIIDLLNPFAIDWTAVFKDLAGIPGRLIEQLPTIVNLLQQLLSGDSSAIGPLFAALGVVWPVLIGASYGMYIQIAVQSALWGSMLSTLIAPALAAGAAITLLATLAAGAPPANVLTIEAPAQEPPIERASYPTISAPAPAAAPATGGSVPTTAQPPSATPAQISAPPAPAVPPIYAVHFPHGGDPGFRFGPPMRSPSPASGQSAAAAAANAAAARERRQSRRKRGAVSGERGRAHEYMDLADQPHGAPPPATTAEQLGAMASQRAAGSMGASGAVAAAARQEAAGLVRVPAGQFDDGVINPLLPSNLVTGPLGHEPDDCDGNGQPERN